VEAAELSRAEPEEVELPPERVAGKKNMKREAGGRRNGEEEEEEREGARLLSRRERGRAWSSGSTPTRRGGLGHLLQRDVGSAAEDRRRLRTVPA